MKKLFSLMLLLATVLSFTACSDDDDNDSKSNYTLHSEETATIKGDEYSGLRWESQNEFAATVEGNEITAAFVGNTILKSTTGGHSLTVEVKPRYNTYKEPELDWNATRSSIKKKYGNPINETEDAYLYTTSDVKAPYLMVLFTGNKVAGYSIISDSDYADEITDFLLERYLPVNVDEQNDTATLVHGYGKMKNLTIDYIVGLMFDTELDSVIVGYAPHSNTKSIETENVDFVSAYKQMMLSK